MSTSRPWSRALSSLLLASLAGCASAPPAPPAAAAAAVAVPAQQPAAPVVKAPPEVPLALLPANAARADQMASITLPSLDRSLASAATLARRVMPLPLDGPALRQMMFEKLGMPEQLAADLDSAVPIGMSVVSLGTGKDGLALAVAAKSPEAAMRILSSGRVVGRRGDAVHIQLTPENKSWFWRFGNVLLMSDSPEALARAGMLAMEARRETPEDMLVVLHPDVIAKNQGTDVKTAVSRWLEESKTQGDLNPEALEGITARIADMSRGEIALVLDAAQGATLGARMFARPGTKLAEMSRDARPFALDPAVTAGDDPVVVMASSYGSMLRDQVAILRNRLGGAKDAKGAAEVVRIADALVEAATGQISGAVRLQPALIAEGVYEIKDAAAAAKLQAAVAGLTKAGAETFWITETRGKSPANASVKSEKVGSLKATHVVFTFDKSKLDEDELRIATEWLGGPKLDVYIAIAGTRLLVAGGNDGRSRLTALAASKAKQPSPALLAALAGVQGRDGFVYLDLARLIAGASAKAKDNTPATRALKNLKERVPLLASYWGDGKGEKLSGALLIPLSALDGLNAALPALLPAFGGGGM